MLEHFSPMPPSEVHTILDVNTPSNPDKSSVFDSKDLEQFVWLKRFGEGRSQIIRLQGMNKTPGGKDVEFFFRNGESLDAEAVHGDYPEAVSPDFEHPPANQALQYISRFKHGLMDKI